MKNKCMVYIFFLLLFSYPSFFPDLLFAQNESHGESDAEAKAFKNQKEVRNALLIANNIYSGNIPSLANPVPEALALKRKLEEIGFKVTLLENGDKYDMEEALFNFEKICKKEGGLAFFHYGGHAVQIDGKNYLIPSHAKVESIGQVDSNCVNVQDIMASMQANENIVVLDSCRDNPFTDWNEEKEAESSSDNPPPNKKQEDTSDVPSKSSSDSTSKKTRGLVANKRGLATIRRSPKNSIVIFSAEAGEPAQDGVYTPSLMQYIKEKNIDLKDMLAKVRLEVQKRTQDEQTPGEYNQLVTKIYLGGLDSDSDEGEQIMGTLDLSTRTPCNIKLSHSMIRSAIVNAELASGVPTRFEFPTGSYNLKIIYKDGKAEHRTGVIRQGKSEVEKLTYLSKEQIAFYLAEAEAFFKGINGKVQNLRKAFEYYKLVATEEDSKAEFAIGYYFEMGQCVAKNEEEAFEWYNKSAKKGNGEAMLRMAIFYHYGKGDVTIDYKKARKWYEKAIENNHSEYVTHQAEAGLVALDALFAKEQEEKEIMDKEMKKEIVDGYEAPLYSFLGDFAYNSSYILDKENGGTIAASGIKLGLMYMQWQFDIITFNMSFNYLLFFGINKHIIGVRHDIRPFDFKLGFAFGRFAFHLGLFQFFFRFDYMGTRAKLNMGLVFGIDMEFRINKILSVYAEYEPSGLYLVAETKDGLSSGHHSFNFGMKINIIFN